ncbi:MULTISPECIES: hypothetical protein [Nocardia]|uniref:Uncharacterized protein n=1 Tax=Nocardia arthritidis TaxID=228602 RepID=A0A6G9YRS9_9NOCA|nr:MULTISPECIES: hypothetical protein [Nocardia]QIS15924.1 hypothetical protein F5544_40540 [Nocardia arthritidis]
MSEPTGVEEILRKLRTQASLTADEVDRLQSHIDQLQNRATEEGTQHHSDSTPGSHHSHHESSATDLIGFLERVTSKLQQPPQ